MYSQAQKLNGNFLVLNLSQVKLLTASLASEHITDACDSCLDKVLSAPVKSKPILKLEVYNTASQLEPSHLSGPLSPCMGFVVQWYFLGQAVRHMAITAPR